MLTRVAVALAAITLAACTTVDVASPPPPSFAYSYVWGGDAPEPYRAQGIAMLDAGQIPILRYPLATVERACGVNRSDSGWFQSACTIYGNATGRPMIVIASEITDPVAIRNIEAHEAAHAAGWPGDHPGGMKPVGHLDRCIRDMNALGLTVRQMGALCYLDGGAPLRTQVERDRWAAMR